MIHMEWGWWRENGSGTNSVARKLPSDAISNHEVFKSETTFGIGGWEWYPNVRLKRTCICNRSLKEFQCVILNGHA